jgi:hypothetical protein
MVLAEHLADHARRFLVGAIPVEAELVHREEHAPVDRLQAVADVGERAADDDGHGVVEIRLPHLLFDRNGRLSLGAHGPVRVS